MYKMRKYIIKVGYNSISTLTFARKWYPSEARIAWDVLDAMQRTGIIEDFTIMEVESFESTY